MSDQQPDGATARYQLICAAVAAAPIFYMGVVSAMKFSGALPEKGLTELPDDNVQLLSIGLLAAGVLSSFSSILLKKLFLNAPQSQSPEGRFKAVLVSMAISESGAVMGLVLMLLTGDLLYGSLLCSLSFAVTCFHFPSRFWLENGDRSL